MRVLVVGYGSIGKRHARLLIELECQVAVVSNRFVDFSPHYFDLEKALVDWQPGYVVIANYTSKHQAVLQTLTSQNFQGCVLVEKPLFHQHSAILKHKFLRVAVAYNLRFHPLLLQLRNCLSSSSKVITANVYVGSYLPDWRPHRDYRQGYSARKQEGGGVLRDLSHELDYVFWLFGSWKRLTAIGGHFSSLEIDSDDAYSILMETVKCPLVSIHMNYLDRTAHREILVNTDRDTLRVDLCKNIIEINGSWEAIEMSQDDTYRAEHLAMLAGRTEELCTLEDASQTLITIGAVERASISRIWIER